MPAPPSTEQADHRQQDHPLTKLYVIANVRRVFRCRPRHAPCRRPFDPVTSTVDQFIPGTGGEMAPDAPATTVSCGAARCARPGRRRSRRRPVRRPGRPTTSPGRHTAQARPRQETGGCADAAERTIALESPVGRISQPAPIGRVPCLRSERKVSFRSEMAQAAGSAGRRQRAESAGRNGSRWLTGRSRPGCARLAVRR